jgi:hypothetical protein
MGRSQDCGMSPYANVPQNFLALANASEPAGSVLHRSAWKDACLIGNFLATADWQNIKVEDLTTVNDAQDIADLKKTMQQHLSDDVLMNIYGEAVDFTPRFENVCLYDGHSHPKTYRLTQTVSQIGWFVVQYFKEKHHRLRPSQVAPLEIRPLIKVPSHPSYPSGHATQSRLVGLVLIDIIGLKAGDPLDDRIREVYDDIGENRERAGVHYTTDTEAGRKLAKDVYGMIREDAKLAAAIDEAKKEWL